MMLNQTQISTVVRNRMTIKEMPYSMWTGTCSEAWQQFWLNAIHDTTSMVTDMGESGSGT